MHATFFAIKRVHLRVLAVTREIIRGYELTPARFDMMRVVLLQHDGIAQATLRWLLGVSAPTVSRMLKSLQEKGFVEREHDDDDRRCLIVRLTPRGRVAVRMCIEETVVAREAERTAARGVLGDARVQPKSYDEVLGTIGAGKAPLAQLDGVLMNMRNAFGDRAPFWHPWRAGSFLPEGYASLFEQRPPDRLTA